MKEIIEKIANSSSKEELISYIKDIYYLSDKDKAASDDLSNLCELLLKEPILLEAKIFIITWLMETTKNNKYTKMFLELILNSGYTYEDMYHLLKQENASCFRFPELATDFDLRYKLLKDIYVKAIGTLSKSYSYIPYEDRNHDFVIVLSSQVLGENHGPTKHALDHCLALMNGMGKRILLINTAEGYSGEVGFYCYNPFLANYVEEYNNLEYLTWKNQKIPFFQCPKEMPRTDVLEMMLDTISSMKPEFVLEIGCGSLLASLAENIVPVLTNGTMHAMIENSITKYQTIARIPQDSELEAIKPTGITRRNLIYSMFTSEVKDKKGDVYRSDIGVPGDAFLVALIGTRLNNEVTNVLIQGMADSIRKNNKIYYIFFGGMESYDLKFSMYSDIKDHFINYGVTNDTMSCLSICDLYLNPDRIGGGMSAIEAMVAGLPAVSTSRGDGGVVLGEDFWIDSIDNYGEKVLEYSLNKEFYDNQATIACKRGKYLTNSQEVFCDTVREFLNRVAEDEGR